MIVRRIVTRTGAALAALALGMAAVAPARASPRSDPTAGRAVFTGATTPHATSIIVDPAAIGLGLANEIYLSASGVVDQATIQLDDIAADGTRTTGPRIGNVELAPAGMIAFIYHLAGEAVTLGFEAHTTPAENFPSDRQALRYHTLGGGQRDWLATVGASFKVTNELFAGASLSHQNTFLRLRYARDTALDNGRAADGSDRGINSPCLGAPCGIANPLAAETYDVDVRSRILSTSNLRVNIGAIYELFRNVWLAVGYHTPPGFAVQSELSGSVDITRAPRDETSDSAPIRGDSVVEIQFPASVDAELRARLPHQLDLHIGGRWEDLSRLQAYDVRVYGSTLPRNAIPEWTERPRGMHDSFALWAGVEQIETERASPYALGARFGVETSSVSTARTSPITIAPLSFSLDLGAQWRLSHAVFQLSYGVQYFPKVHSEDSAFDPRDRLECIDSNYDYSTPACKAVREGYAIASGAGDYTRIQHAVRLGLRYEFP